MSATILDNLLDQIDLIDRANLRRVLRVRESPQAVRLRLDGKDYLSFCSNDYLGLANDCDLIAACHDGLKSYGLGSGASHLISGHSLAHDELENQLADFLKVERVLLFSCGYMANVGLQQALLDRQSVVLQDRLNHASLIDGALLGRARLRRYRHLDMGHLHSLLQPNQTQSTLIVSDGVFSMDGDLAPLPDLCKQAADSASALVIDDAHGIGVLGTNGRGLFEHFDLIPDIEHLVVGTLGKAFGVFGAFVAGSSVVIEYLLQKSRTYIYTTAMPAALAVAAQKSLTHLRADNWRREKLQQSVHRFRRGCEKLGLRLLPSITPIQALVVGEAVESLKIERQLKDAGILVSAIRPPTVPEHTARIRFTFSATHNSDDVDRLLSVLAGGPSKGLAAP